MKQNIDIWDFSLNENDMKNITALDLGYSVSNDPTALGASVGSNQWKIHD
jgi:diketogulonate reductase-like aldo/keto reductase